MSPRGHARAFRLALGLLALGLMGSLEAQELLMARSPEDFPETMLRLQDSLVDHGYTVSRVQRVDIGLTESGFITDKYRIVFFGKPEEVRTMAQQFPQLIPYLPLQMTVFEEGEETVIVTADPLMLQKLVADPEVSYVFMRWKSDLLSVMEDLRGAR
jgi:uncharacterized protein (DUF302 family)